MSKRLYRLRQIIAPDGVLPIGRTLFYKAIAEGRVPPPQKFGHVSLWDADSIDAVLTRILAGEFGPEFSKSSATMSKRARDWRSAKAHSAERQAA